MLEQSFPVLEIFRALAIAAVPYLLLIPFEAVGLFIGILLSGARPTSVIVPPFAFVRSGQTWHVRFGPRWFAFVGYYTIQNPRQEIVRRLIPFVELGAISGGGIGLAIQLRESVNHLPALLAVFVVPVALGQVIQTFRRSIATLSALHVGGVEADRRVAIQMLSSRSASGERPARWDPALVEVASAAPDRYAGAPTVAGYLLAHEFYLDRGDTPAAEMALNRAVANTDAFDVGWRMRTNLAAAFFDAYFRRDDISARQHYGIASIYTLEHHTRLRIKAAVLLAEGRLAEAREAAMSGLRKLNPTMDAGMAAVDQDRLQAILFEIDAIAIDPELMTERKVRAQWANPSATSVADH